MASKSVKEKAQSSAVIAIAAATASAIANVGVYPLDLIVTRIQTRKGYTENPYTALKRIVRETGWQSLYSGLSADCLSTFLSNYLFFLAHTVLHKTWARRRSSANKIFSAYEEILLGSLAGMIARAVTTPISLITVRLQSQSTSAKTISGHVREKQPSDTDDGSGSDEENDENTVAQICHDIYSEQGWTGFWSGYKSNIVLTLQPSLSLYIFSLLKTVLLPKSKREHPPTLVTFLTSASAGAFASALTYPLMLSKTRLQSRSKGKRQYKSTTAFFTQIYQRYGVSGLYVGLYAQIVKTFFSQGFTMLFKERIELLFLLTYARLRSRHITNPLSK